MTMKAVFQNFCIFLLFTIHVSCFPRRNDVTLNFELERPSYSRTADTNEPEVTLSENFSKVLSPNSSVELNSFLENDDRIVPYDKEFKRQSNLHPCHLKPPSISTILHLDGTMTIIRKCFCKRRTLFACLNSIVKSQCEEVPASYRDSNGRLVYYARDCKCSP
ncbi:uncharacterized protein LOC116295863 [Actinia tenebrosa]|uniref:Uncharacterized protein LOC116295863 n=1 Tax=Actinia tenebrosa TaxID=6105 RepID=A0A6P8I4G7_ACTTE|nr:uncharacterized protein LOC116295863 [Actinia tenebrosa]